jgi:hypothetical protein
MRLSIAWLLPKDWLAAHVLQAATDGLSYFHPVPVRREENDALHRAVWVLVQSLQKHCLLARPPMVLSYLGDHTGNHGPAGNRQFVLFRMHMLYSPLGTSAAPAHRLLQRISWLLGSSF